MRWLQLLAAGLAALAILPATAGASPRVSVGLSFGFPFFPCYRPYWGCGPYYYRPYPYYYAPPTAVIVQPSPVVVGAAPPVLVSAPPATVAQSVPPQSVPPQPAPPPPVPVVVRAAAPSVEAPGDVERQLQLLANSQENIRQDAVMALGHSRIERAVEPLAATLAGDRSPVVRDAAARALGLIGSPRALTALIHAAQADTDRDVRRSAQFAVEVIQANQRPR